MNPGNSNNPNIPIESDSQKIVRRHLENEDDEITDADIRNVRIVGEDDVQTPVAAAEAEIKNKEGLKDEDGAEDEDDDLPDPNEKPVTPWDVIT